MTHSFIAIAQLNPIVGDISGNAEKILAAYDAAQKKNAKLVLCPELCLIGYPPEDLVLSPAFRAQAMLEAERIVDQTKDAALVFGTLWEEAGAVYNAAIFAHDGRIQHIQYKNKLPNYGIFDEKRIFIPGHNAKVFEWQGTRYGLMICEDVWYPELARELKSQQVEKVIVINASPFERGKLAQRKQVVAEFAQGAHAPVVYVNAVGGQDDIVFDGASFAVDEKGYVIWEAAAFEPGIFVIPSEAKDLVIDNAKILHCVQDDNNAIWSAMKLGLADYVNKNGFKGVLLGLSGGIDSAVSCAVAVDALGADKVFGVLLPSPYTSKDSVADALELAKNLGIKTDTIPITPAMETFDEVLSPHFKDAAWMENPALGGNLQARLRGITLMALSNKTGFMLLSTGNKSEIAVGYSTLYGDSCGGYNVLKDVYKTEVYALANWRNAQGAVIPGRSITKAPTAELKPGQKDEDQLPPYDVLDRILELHIEARHSAAEIIAKGFDAATVARVMQMVRASEYKRRQSCPGVKLSTMMFGRDRRYPLTNKF